MNFGRLFWNWEPWRELEAPSWRSRHWEQARSCPPINVSESEDGYGLEIEVPGADREKLEVTVEGDLVTVKGEYDHSGEESGMRRQERPTGNFSRMLRFPVKLDAEAVQAHYVDGVLTVKLPKAPEAKPHKIDVKTG